MKLILKRQWEIPTGVGKETTIIGPGEYEVEEIPNPYGHKAPWLVLKGTTIGATRGFWKQWEGKKWGEYEVRIIP